MQLHQVKPTQVFVRLLSVRGVCDLGHWHFIAEVTC